MSAALEAKLDNVVSQLKNIANRGFSFQNVVGPDGKPTKKGKVDKEEAEKIKITAQITANASANVYKKVLGLGFNEENTKKTAKIFKDIFGMSGGGGGGGVGSRKGGRGDINYMLRQMEWFDFKSDLLHYAFNSEEYQEEMLYNMKRLVGLQTTPKDKKKSEAGGLMDKLKSIAGLAALGVGFFFIINALSNAGKIDEGKIFKILLVIGAIVGIFLFISKAFSNVLTVTLIIGGLVFLIGYLAENLQKYANKDWNSIDDGLKRAGVAFGSLMIAFGIIAGITKLGGKVNALISGGVMTGMVYIIGYLAENLEKYINKDWNSIDDGLKRAGLAFGSLVLAFGIIAGITKLGGQINTLIASGVMTGMVYLIGYLAENLEKYINKDWNSIDEGLKSAGLAFGSLVAAFGIIAGITKLGGELNTLIAGGIMYEMVYLIGYLAENLDKFSNKDWDSIDSGLKRAGLAFGSLVAAFGIIAGITVLTGEITSLIAGGVMLALAKVMDMSADSLIKFGNINGDNLIDVAKGMAAIGGGLVAMLGGTAMGTVGALTSGLASLVGLDPVSFIKKFEVLDASKLLSLGTGIKYLAEGLKTLSQGIELKNIIKDLILLTTPLLSFTNALDSFSNSYKQLEKIKMESEINQNYNMNLKTDTGIQKAILDLHTQELSVQEAQLEQLKINGNLLYQLVSNGGMGGGISAPQPKTTIKSPSFSTKDNYLNNMKLTSMSLQG